MPIFFFWIEAKPTPAARNAADLGGALVHVFVQSETLDSAEVIARSHVLDYAWVTTAVKAALEPTPEQIADLDAALVALHQRAAAEGIASEFVAWPREDRPGEPIELRSLGNPVIDDETPQ